MTEEGTSGRSNAEVLRRWRGSFIGAREAQHLRDLLRRGALGELTAEELPRSWGVCSRIWLRPSGVRDRSGCDRRIL